MKKIEIKEVLDCLDKGMSRKEIANHFGISMTVLREKVFSHEKLKGKRPKGRRKGVEIKLIDNTSSESENISENAVWYK